MGANLIGPGAPAGCDVVLSVVGWVVGTVATVLSSLATADNVLVEPADPIQERCREAVDFVAVTAFLEKIVDFGLEAFGVAVDDGGVCDSAAPIVESRIVERWIPILILPGIEAACDDLSEIVVVSNVRETKDTLQFRGSGWILQANQNFVDHIGDLLVKFDTFLISVNSDGLEVCPVVQIASTTPLDEMVPTPC